MIKAVLKALHRVNIFIMDMLHWLLYQKFRVQPDGNLNRKRASDIHSIISHVYIHRSLQKAKLFSISIKDLCLYSYMVMTNASECKLFPFSVGSDLQI